MASWPPYLPQRLRVAGQSIQPKQAFHRTEMDHGPAKQRRRFSAVPEAFEGSLVMSSDELELFREFWGNDLEDGALSFTWVHPYTLLTATVRFTSAYRYEPIGPLMYLVSLSGEVLPS